MTIGLPQAAEHLRYASEFQAVPPPADLTGARCLIKSRHGQSDLDVVGIKAADQVARRVPPLGCALIMFVFVAGLFGLLFWLGSR
jgi:hypothetical protein